MQPLQYWSLQKDSIADISAMIVSSCLYSLPARAGPVSESDVDSGGGGPSVAGTDSESDEAPSLGPGPG